MKKLIIVIALFFVQKDLLGQPISVDLQYSGLINAVNNTSTSIYTLTGNYEFNKDFSAGLSVSLLDGTLVKNFVSKAPPNDNVTETMLYVGINSKYYPSVLSYQEILKPYLGIELGIYVKEITLGISGNTLECEDQYKFDANKYFYTNIIWGTLLFPDKFINFVVEAKYQIRNPDVTYLKPNCFLDQQTTYTEFTESVNLNMFLWSLGVRINFN